MNPELFVVGKIVGVFGIRGFLKIQPSTHNPDRFFEIERLYVGRTETDAAEVGVEEVTANDKSLLMKLTTTPDRTAAEHYIGKLLFVTKEDLEAPKKGSYFVHDVVGCEVWSSDGNHIGSIAEVYKTPGQDLWEVATDGKRHLVPAVKEFIEKVDVKRRRITLKPIEGLFE